MIIIFSKKEDQNVDNVIRHLIFAKIKVMRFSFPISFDELQHLIYVLNNINKQNTTACWFSCDYFNISDNLTTERSENNQILDCLYKDLNTIINHFYYKYRSEIRFLNTPNLWINKLITLEKAKESGLNVPKTWIVNEKKALQELLNEQALITKTISSNFQISLGTLVSNAFRTYQIDKSIILNHQDFFYPSLVQEEIQKLLELRIFYLDGSLFCGAIFSQANADTKVDFRNFNSGKMIKIIPFILPNIISKKVINFMALTGFNMASIDMILSKDEEYYFLEANPGGQYSFLSNSCNFNLDYQIAKYLIHG